MAGMEGAVPRAFAMHRRTRGKWVRGEREETRQSVFESCAKCSPNRTRTFFIIPAFLLLKVMCRLLLSWMNSILIFRRPALVESVAEERRAAENRTRGRQSKQKKRKFAKAQTYASHLHRRRLLLHLRVPSRIHRYPQLGCPSPVHQLGEVLRRSCRSSPARKEVGHRSSPCSLRYLPLHRARPCQLVERVCGNLRW